MNVVSEVIDKISENSSASRNAVSGLLAQRIVAILDELCENGGDIMGCLVSRADGIALGHKLPDDFDVHRFAAMSSSLLALGDTFAKEASKGLINSVLVEGIEGNIYVVHAGPNLVLTIITQKNSNLGMTLAYARRAVERIGELMI